MRIKNFFIKYIWLIMQHYVIIVLHLKNYGQYISSYQLIFIQIGEISFNCILIVFNYAQIINFTKKNKTCRFLIIIKTNVWDQLINLILDVEIIHFLLKISKAVHPFEYSSSIQSYKVIYLRFLLNPTQQLLFFVPAFAIHITEASYETNEAEVH